MTAPAPPPPTVPPHIAAMLASLLPAAPSPASGPSKTLLAVGATGTGLAVYITERLLADDGLVAANMLSKLSPVLGPIWASYPSLVIMLGIAGWAAMKWRAAQHARGAAELAAAIAAEAQRVEFHGIRGEVHTMAAGFVRLETALARHIETTDTRITAVQADVSKIGNRVDRLEKPTRRRAAR